jgi:hypothetical protein
MEKYYKLTLDAEDMMIDSWERISNILKMINEECSKGNTILLFSVPDENGCMPNNVLNQKIDDCISAHFNVLTDGNKES